MAGSWDEIWESRQLDPSARSTLSALLSAGGFDTPTARLSEADWVNAIDGIVDQIELNANGSVFEVGCGAGAFLYVLYTRGYTVSGIDRSRTLVDYARSVMPQGHFEVAAADAFDTTQRTDTAICNSVFLYFPSLDYATRVIRRMASKATRAVAILDIPDLATKDEAIRRRVELAGGGEAYAARYAGLDHLYYARDWFAEALTAAGLSKIQVWTQPEGGSENSRFRFNALATH
jgi:trans-aconitate methyltransferase